MKLKFKQKINGIDMQFPFKIANGYKFSDDSPITLNQLAIMEDEMIPDYLELIDMEGIFLKDYIPKIHTIRKDDRKRWHDGENLEMDMIIEMEDGTEFQFLPTMKLQSIQIFQIEWAENRKSVWIKFGRNEVKLFLDIMKQNRSKPGLESAVMELVRNDGFPDLETFLEYFDQNFIGKILQFTKFRY